MSNSKIFHVNKLFKLLNIRNREDLKIIAKKIEIPMSELEYYNNEMVYPNGDVLDKIAKYTCMNEKELKLRLGVIDYQVVEWISNNPKFILDNMATQKDRKKGHIQESYTTELGKIFRDDCMNVLKSIESDSVDMVFADPPFNLSKEYESGINDNISDEEYLIWTEKWLLECIRVLKPGGALFVYNIPKWLTYTSNILNKYLTFRHWIAINLRGVTPPISKKLNVNHYGVLYYVKGSSPSIFNTQRIPMKTCRHCGGEIHDYGGKKKDVKKSGQTISDVWEDIHPVKHKGHKNRESNELPIKLLFRLIELSTSPGSLILDPFGGSGTTYSAAEILNRKWIGCEIGPIESIITRLKNNDHDMKIYEEVIRESNVIFTEAQRRLRIKNKFWLPEDFE